MKLLLALCLLVSFTPQQVNRVVDGDTFDVTIIRTFVDSTGVWPSFTVTVQQRERVRLLEADTPERGRPGFGEAAFFVTEWLQRGPSYLQACKRDFNGRLLAWLWQGADTLNKSLIASGHAVRWSP